MTKPMKFRRKPVEAEGMLYTGDNFEDIVSWVRETDPEAMFKKDVVLPAARPARFAFGDGSTVINMPVSRYLDIYTVSYSLRLWVGWWLFKVTPGGFIPYDPTAVERDYDRIWPEPLPGV